MVYKVLKDKNVTRKTCVSTGFRLKACRNDRLGRFLAQIKTRQISLTGLLYELYKSRKRDLRFASTLQTL